MGVARFGHSIVSLSFSVEKNRGEIYLAWKSIHHVLIKDIKGVNIYIVIQENIRMMVISVCVKI